jgi:hypothetical protein
LDEFKEENKKIKKVIDFILGGSKWKEKIF